MLGINHGALGVVAWDDPTTADIKSSASALAKALGETMKAFVLEPSATFSHVVLVVSGGAGATVDVGRWTVGEKTLVLATNLAYAQATIALGDVLPPGAPGEVEQVFDSGVSISGASLVFESVGSGAFIFG